MKKLVILSMVVGLVSGCAYSRQYATTSSVSTNGLPVITMARSTAFALGDAKTVIDKTRASAGKTSSVGASGIDESASTSNIATNLNALTSLLQALK
jgi:hypothetical protein